MAAERKRLFFALWPDPVTRQSIARRTANAAQLSGGKCVKPANLHLTLAFLHSVDTTLLPCISTAAAAAAASPGFTIELSRIGRWRRSGILWLAPDLQGGAQTGQLAADLWAALEQCGFTPERRPFQPHVTLARKAHMPFTPIAIEPVQWRVTELALVESTDAGSHPRYEVLRRFELGS